MVLRPNSPSAVACAIACWRASDRIAASFSALCCRGVAGRNQKTGEGGVDTVRAENNGEVWQAEIRKRVTG